jgi:aminotransferase EvaB
MSINVWGYLDEYAQERRSILAAVERVFESGSLVLGDAVTGFESEFAARHGVRYGVGVDNGTNAITLALEACGVGPGDEVITVSNTAAPTVLAIVNAGATPVFVDVREDDFLLDVTRVEAAMTSRTRAVVPVHLYGQCVDMAPLQQICDAREIALIEDCAQSHGAMHHGRVAGSMGRAAAFSFYPTKVLGAYGDGGAVITDDPDTDAALRRLRYYGMEETYYVEQLPGHNSRLDAVQAAILHDKLTRLDDYIAARQRVAARYADALSDLGDLTLPQTNPGNTHVHYVYVARHPRRDDVIAGLREHGINVNISYPWPVHTMRGFDHLKHLWGPLPVTERLAGEIFSLPMYPSLSEDQQSVVVSAVRDVVKQL